MYGEFELPALDSKSVPSRNRQDAVSFIRPHDIEVLAERNGAPSIEVVVRHVNAAGGLARLEMQIKDTGETLDVEIPRSLHGELNLKQGDRAFVKIREARTFLLAR
jgi:sulfate/thiosulfate transport system ATP-binding protein